MPNPFVIGSGPPGTNYTVMKRAFDEGWGAVIAKTVISLSLSLSRKTYDDSSSNFDTIWDSKMSALSLRKLDFFMDAVEP